MAKDTDVFILIGSYRMTCNEASGGTSEIVAIFTHLLQIFKENNKKRQVNLELNFLTKHTHDTNGIKNIFSGSLVHHTYPDK